MINVAEFQTETASTVSRSIVVVMLFAVTALRVNDASIQRFSSHEHGARLATRLSTLHTHGDDILLTYEELHIDRERGSY